MPNLVVIARIIEHAKDLFVVVVSTTPAAPTESQTVTDVEITDVRTRDEAIVRQNKMIGAIVDRAQRRGDQIVRVRRLSLDDAALYPIKPPS
jgi:hypothetical protein